MTGPSNHLMSARSGDELTDTEFGLAALMGSALRRRLGAIDAVLWDICALAVEAPASGHVCVQLGPDQLRTTASAPNSVVERPSEPAALGDGAPAVDPYETVAPFVLDDGGLYTRRFWEYERQVAQTVLMLAEQPQQPLSTGHLADLDALFGARTPGVPDDQRAAAALGLASDFAIVAGGPGTGKTRTIARMLAALLADADRSGRRIEIALAAPTGKAAARMTQSIRREVAANRDTPLLGGDAGQRLAELEAVTIHRLLGSDRSNPYSASTFRHNTDHPLPADVLVVDEASMVSMPLMAHLLAAVRPAAKVVFVGDPYQLASVEAGSVLSDMIQPALDPARSMTGPLADRIVVLRRSHRFPDGSSIARLAESIRTGSVRDAETLLSSASGVSEPRLSGSTPAATAWDTSAPPVSKSSAASTSRSSGQAGIEIEWIRRDDAVQVEALIGVALQSALDRAHAAMNGDAPTALAQLGAFNVLCANRQGPGSVAWWNATMADRIREADPRIETYTRWYAGRPVLVTANDYVNHLSNGDTGVVVAAPDGGLAVAIADTDPVRLIEPSRLDSVETMWSMTIHKSQGSEFDHVVVSLPEPPSVTLTRELLYTAVTRAKRKVTVLASPAALEAAIATPVARISGLESRLWSET